MDDFFHSRRRTQDPFFEDDGFFSPNQRPQFDNPFFGLHHSMTQIHREMDEMMRHAFSSFGHPFSHPFGNQFGHPFNQQPNQPSITHPQQPSQPQITYPKDQDLDKQVQQYGLDSVLNDNSYLSDWDFVKQLEQLEKTPRQLQPSDPSNRSPHFYGRTHVYSYRSNGDGKVEEKKMVQDSKGNRMESIKRQLGDKLWARTVRRDGESGEVNEDEKLMNMDDSEKQQFVNNWKSNNHGKKHVTIDALPEPVSDDRNPTQFTLPSLTEQKKSSWTDKLKFWK